MREWVRAFRGLGLVGVVLGGIALSTGAGSILLARPAAAQGASMIVVEGNRRVEADTIRAYFRAGAGGRIDAVAIDQALKALYSTGLFQDVRISQAGGRIIVTVVEAPVINRIQFEGNKKVKDEQLLGEIQSKPRGALSRAVVQADVARLTEVYRRNGRFDIRVEPKIIELPNNRVDLVFEITEGSKTTVRRIEFVGNNFYGHYKLKDVIKTSETNLLSFLKSGDIYDPDRLEADRDLIRRFYLKHGFADVRVVAAAAEFDPERGGFVITFTIDEGERYRFGAVDVQSNVRDVDPESLRARIKTVSGAFYNAEAVEKSVEDMTIEMSRRGYPFSQVRPRGDRNPETRLINIIYLVEEGSRAYVERINIRGNTRTRDYVIRREFDIAEGDAYNRVLVDRAERRLKNLGYFKVVKITNEPGSAPDRIVINVDVEEQPTGEFSVSGGYSTADGFIGEVSVGERNLLGRGQYAKASLQYGQYARGFSVGFVEPFFLDYRLAMGVDFFAKISTSSTYQAYGTETYGGAVRFGIPLREDLALQLRYSLFTQKTTLDQALMDCSPLNPPPNCFANGEVSIALKQTVLNGATWTSAVGYSLTYNTVDNNKNPTTGVVLEFKQDFAGVGGDVNFLKTAIDGRTYYEFYPDLVGVLRGQAGHVTGWGGKDLRMLDHYFGGPQIVRGFAPFGFGPRDITLGTNQDAIGGSMFWAVSAEVQTPIPNVPKDIGVKVAAFVDAGNVWGYQGQTVFPAFGQTLTIAADSASMIRSAVGVGVIWDSPFGPLRLDYAYALSSDGNDRLQQIRFGGGTKF